MGWELSLAVVGIDFNKPDEPEGSRRAEIDRCARGDWVELRREPDNEKDPRAVAVYSERGVQLGYVRAERAPLIGSRISNGEDWEAVFQEAQPTAAIIRIRFGGGGPTLPPPRASEEPPPFDDLAHECDDTDWGA